MKAYLIRHAHAGDRDSWEGDDRLRPLTEKGRGQARGLARTLADADIARVVSSPYLRCVQTVEPLAGAEGLPVEEDDAFAEGAPWRGALARLAEADAPLVACSQGDVIGAIVEDLVGRGVIAARDARWQKGGTWALRVKDGEITGAEYLPPLEVD